MVISTNYFRGFELTKREIEEGRLSYGTLARSFNHVLVNGIIKVIQERGEELELISGYNDNESEIEELDETIEELEEYAEELESVYEQLHDVLSDINLILVPECFSDDSELLRISDNIDEELDRLNDERKGVLERISELETERDELEEEQNNIGEVFQWYLVDDSGAEILKDIDEVLYYSEEFDVYIWGVTHYGTAWDYVNTCIKVSIPQESNEA